jgi:hypothetical protein
VSRDDDGNDGKMEREKHTNGKMNLPGAFCLAYWCNDSQSIDLYLKRL